MLLTAEHVYWLDIYFMQSQNNCDTFFIEYNWPKLFVYELFY